MIADLVSFLVGRQASGLFAVFYVAGYTMETTGFYQALFSFRLAWQGILC
jgi:uncharacterized membrane protein YccC